jgi:hypothetical protein
MFQSNITKSQYFRASYTGKKVLTTCFYANYVGYVKHYIFKVMKKYYLGILLQVTINIILLQIVKSIILLQILKNIILLQVSESKDSCWSRHCLHQELRTQNSE